MSGLADSGPVPAGLIERAERLARAMIDANDPAEAALMHADFQASTGWCLVLLGDGVAVVKLPDVPTK